MSAHHNHAPAAPDQRLVLLPDGAAVHQVVQPHKHFKFRQQEATPLGISGARAFEHNTPGMQAERFAPVDSLHQDPNQVDESTTALLKNEQQNVYAVIEAGKDATNTQSSVNVAQSTLHEYWEELTRNGINVTKDNAKEYMDGALDTVKRKLVEAGHSEREYLSLGLTMVKLFRHGDGWGAAIAHAGNTTHGMMTNHNKAAIKGHGHTPDTRTGRLIDTQAEYDPYVRPKRFKVHPDIKQSSLNSDGNDGPTHERVAVIPRILRSTEIVLCNDQAIGTNKDPLTVKPADALAVTGKREAALLDSNSPDEAMSRLFAIQNDPKSVAIHIRLEELPPEPTPVTAVKDRMERIVDAGKRGAKILREFATDDTPEAKKRRRQVAVVAGSVAVAAGAVIAYRKLPDAHKEALVRGALERREVAARRAGELLVKARETTKEKSKTVTGKAKEKVAVVKQQAKQVAKKAPEVAAPQRTAGTSQRKERVINAAIATGAKAKNATEKAKEARERARQAAARFRRNRRSK